MDPEVTIVSHSRRGPMKRLKRFWSSLGPGVIAGAADDDPSGIATYTIAGAQLGTTLLWTAFLTWPLMMGVQLMCARIGMVTGRGLAAAFRTKLPRLALVLAVVGLLTANVINIGADLAGMADATDMLTGVNSHFWVLLYAVVISWATVRFRYHQIANTLKWLALVLFAYVVTAFVVHPDWWVAMRDTFVPRVPRDKLAWETLVAILGTTISPYLFFWQAAQEVEEERQLGRFTLHRRQGATPREIRTRKMDVGVGTFASNLVMYFIILVAAFTLHRGGATNIESSREAASALRPLAGNLAFLLYALGIVGVGLLAIPTLTGSAAYAFAETFGWRQGLDRRLRQARSFYGVILMATLIAVLLDFSRVSPVQALYWSAVINGCLAPFLIVGILLVASDKKLMRGQPSSMLSRVVVGLTALAMFAAAVAMILL
ncbi:MAG TPA: Nramp family divalent metal transporter [Terriglobales bacterium]|nr:Nramp family divalent metal transporter [Terriglobales bacterium]